MGNAKTKRWPDVIEEQRIQCPNSECGSRNVKCTFVDSKYGAYVIKRLYVCRDCGVNFETHEQWRKRSP